MDSIYAFDAIPGSTDKNPFEISNGAEYFVWRNGGDGLRFTYLCSNDPMDVAMEFYPMGYTNLGTLRRLLLWCDGEVLEEIADVDGGSKSDKQGDYRVFCSQENISQHFGRRHPDDKYMHYGLDTMAAAKEWLARKEKKPGQRYIIAKQLSDIEWH